LEEREPRRYSTIDEAVAQMRKHNKRLPPDLALHLATFGTRRNADDTYSWKFDPCQRARVPHRLSPDDHVSLWSRITCPVLLLNAAESFLQSSQTAGLASHFQNARSETVSGVGHWLHHDKPDEILGSIRAFLGLTEGR
jgi:pimeloyl-ACP methyl ester carboxylesterase